MPRKYAFVYATGDGRHAGEVKVGNTSAENVKQAVAKVTSRYKTVHGRCPVVYKVIPVGLPKKDAEDIIKLKLAPYHNTGELFDLPTADIEETQRFLDLAYGDLEVPFADAHFVNKPSASDRKAEIEREREELVVRAEERLEHKRARLEAERVAEEEHVRRRQETKRVKREAQREEEARRSAEDLAKRQEERAKREAASDVTQWLKDNVHQQDGEGFTLKDAHILFKAGGGETGRNHFRALVEAQLGSACFHPQKWDGHKVRKSVFFGFALNTSK